MSGALNTARTSASACTTPDGLFVKGRNSAQAANMQVALVGNPVFQPLHEADLLWGAEGYELWSDADLTYGGVRQLIRPRKSGQGGWGFYLRIDDGPVVSAWWALVSEQIDVVELIARARTYFSLCARMVEARADVTARSGPSVWAYDIRSYMRKHNITNLQLHDNLGSGGSGVSLKSLSSALKGGESSLALRTSVAAALRRIDARRKIG